MSVLEEPVPGLCVQQQFRKVYVACQRSTMASAHVGTHRVLRLSTPTGESLNTDITSAGQHKMEGNSTVNKVAPLMGSIAMHFCYHGS